MPQYFRYLNVGGGGGSGTITGAANVGTGQGQIYRDTTSGTINLKTLKQGGGITITNNADDVTLTVAGAGTGDVVGPGSATDKGFTRFDGTTGKLIQNTGTGSTLSDAGTATFAQVIDSGLTASTVPYANASKQLTSSAVTPTELGYVAGVTSALQTQINAKAPSASPTFSGTITTPFGTGVVHSSSGGVLSSSAVDLAADVTGNLPVTNLNSGTSASSATFWRGDGTWAAAGATAPKYCLYSNGAGQTIASGNVDVLLFPTSISDPSSLVTNPGTNWTFTAQTTCPHSISVSMMFTASNKVGYLDIDVYVNGSLRKTLLDSYFNESAYDGMTATGLVLLNSGETMQLNL